MKVSKLYLTNVEGIKDSKLLKLKAKDTNNNTHIFYMDTKKYKNVDFFCGVNGISTEMYLI